MNNNLISRLRAGASRLARRIRRAFRHGSRSPRTGNE
jgi:hypothetical protein